jgi:cytochrome P450
VGLNEQVSGPSEMKAALMDQLQRCMFDYNLFTLWKVINPYRQMKIMQNSRAMHNFLVPRIQERIGQSAATNPTGIKTIIDLAMKTFNEEVEQEGVQKVPDKAFIKIVVAQLIMFMFAGHDTTATTLCWILHTLQKHPTEMARVRSEHDSVFGKDLSKAVEQLRTTPHLLNSLPYTMAVIKETLRLFPSVGSIREGSPDISFTVPGFKASFPTEGFMVWDGIRAAMRAEHIWQQPNDFLPDRWLVDAEHSLHPVKNAWRPFGTGPRVCIGQELAITEIKLVLVLVLRELDIDCAWSEWDLLR